MQIKETTEIKNHIINTNSKTDAANMFLVQQLSEDPLFEYKEEYHKKPINAIAEDFYEVSYADNELLTFVLDKIKKVMTTKRFKSARENYLNDAFVKMILLKGLYTNYTKDIVDEDSDLHVELTLFKNERNDLIEFGDYIFMDGVYVPKFALVDRTFFYPVLTENGETYNQFSMKDYMELRNKPAKMHGKVLILKDVFGYMMYHASRREDVEEVVVICDDNEMEFDFLKDFVAKNCKHPDKIKVVNQNVLDYVKTIKNGDFDYIFANVCEFASADEMLIRRELKLKGIKCDYHLENHYAKYLAPTISTMMAEELGIEEAYINKRQELIVSKEKFEYAQQYNPEYNMDDDYDEYDCDDEISEYEEYAYSDIEVDEDDFEENMEALREEWTELINEMIEDTQFEVDMIKLAYDDVIVRNTEDMKKVLSPSFILEKL